MLFITKNKNFYYQKFNMYPRTYQCSGCSKEVSVDIPFICKNIVGLCSEVCCKEEFRIYRGRPKDQKIQQNLNEAFNQMFEEV